MRPEVPFYSAKLQQLLVALFMVVIVCCIVPAQADVVYSNFGPGMTFDNGADWVIGLSTGPFNSGQEAIAQQFTPAGNYTFSDAQVAVLLFGGPDSIDVFLQADSNGLPGAVIEEIPISGLGSTPTILTANSALFPVLQNGTPYWLTLVAGADGVMAGWDFNSIGDASASTFALTLGGSPAGPWGTGFFLTRSAFEIDGVTTSTVPEPSTLLLLGCALTTLACRVWCKQLR